MSRSPLDMLIDNACGVNAVEPATPKVVDLESISKAMLMVCDAAEKWHDFPKAGTHGLHVAVANYQKLLPKP